MQGAFRVLTDETTEEELRLVATAMGWPLIEEITKETSPTKLQWASHDRLSLIEYIDDPLIGIQYLRIMGEGVAAIAKLTTVSRVAYTASQVLARARDAVDLPAQALGVREAAIAAPRAFDERFYDVVVAGSRHAHPGVRKVAIQAFLYLSWRELVPMLEELERSDPEPGLRKYARIAIEEAVKFDWHGKFQPPDIDLEDVASGP